MSQLQWEILTEVSDIKKLFVSILVVSLGFHYPT